MTPQDCLKSRRYYNFDIELYPDCEYVNRIGMPVTCEKLLDYIRDWSCVKEYAYNYHNLDVDNSGFPKKPHYHLWLKMKSQHTCQQISNKWGIPITNFALYKHFVKKDNKYIWDGSYEEPDRTKRLRYLIHADNKEKVQYSQDNIRTNIIGFVWRPDESPQTMIDIVKYRKEHTFEDTFYMAVETGNVKLLKQMLPFLDRIEKENTAFYSNASRAYAMVLEDMRKSCEEYAKKSIEMNVPDFIRQGWKSVVYTDNQ